MSSQPPRQRFVIGLFLIVAVVQVLYRPSQCSSLMKYLATEYNLSHAPTKKYQNYTASNLTNLSTQEIMNLY
ncbi:fasciclin-1 isoform X3 [Aphis craccivora]|uniref:Fasciclin-1 isoform X3 n=1 Tax=Aphis craccivora TaxID=307492 RepID=A0A6G0ZLD4_APHCR|nr:fasciclin-1 isoform X3 [Aphis craccivora]